MFRRFPRRDLDTARQMVSRAEREALDRAEALARQAADILAVIRQNRAEVAAGVGADVERDTEMDALRADLDAAPRRAGAAELELELLRASSAHQPPRAEEPADVDERGTETVVDQLTEEATEPEGLVWTAVTGAEAEAGEEPPPAATEPDGDAERRRAAIEDRSVIESQLSAEIANMAAILDRTRDDLEELLAELVGRPDRELDLREDEGAQGAGVGGR